MPLPAGTRVAVIGPMTNATWMYARYAYHPRPGATRSREIKSNFRRLCLKFHPDKYSPDLGISPEQGMAMFQMYNNAYEFLRDPANRPR